MPPLPTQLRNRLEAAVKQARRTAEAAAKVALERLTVGSAEPGSHLTVDERQLRNRLRAHGRQLGDQRDPKTGTQSINRLIHECAYEHWHRMLFARFLAENHLLMHPDGVAVSLAECDELARDVSADDGDSRRWEIEGEAHLRKSASSADGKSVEDGWTLAARYAARMLPQIFRPDDPVLQVSFAPEHKRALEKLVTELPVEVFTAEDSLGWVYQFWQAERKDEVNKSGDKITGETLPAVTQLFTEHYMVLFLLHNTIGAWWAARLKAKGKIQNAKWEQCQTEDDCRKLVALPGYEFTYLRFIRTDAAKATPSPPSEGGEGRGEVGSAQPSTLNPQQTWVPAAGSFPGWPKSLEDFKLLDPCCGSGHFLIAAFELLVRLRMVDEGLSSRDACDAVLRENLHGLELDPRCTQIAAFALALAAWKFPDIPSTVSSFCIPHSSFPPLGFRQLPPLNVACSGLGVNARKEDWLALANGDTRLRSGLEQLYDLFQKAPDLGSLINPRRLAHGDLVTASFAEIQPLLTKALQSEKAKRNDDLNEIGVAAQGMAKAAILLAEEYQLVVTNVPYLLRRKQDEVLQTFSDCYYADARTDLATVFVQRCREFMDEGGSSALVTPQNWLFLGSYSKLRKSLLSGLAWNWLARLGAGAFETIGGEVVNVALVSVTRLSPTVSHSMSGIDASSANTPSEKAELLRHAQPLSVRQKGQLAVKDCVVTFEEPSKLPLLERYAAALNGSHGGDSPRFRFLFWEIPAPAADWRLFQGTVENTAFYAGRENIFFWGRDGRIHYENPNAYIKGEKFWGKHGVVVRMMGELPVTLYTGEMFDISCTPIVPYNESHLSAIWAFCSSDEYTVAVRKIDQKLNVTNATLAKVPFDLARWQRVAAEKYPKGLPEPDSNDPTQWLFNGRLADSIAPLQVGAARLLGYRWPRQTGQTVSGAQPVPEDGLDKFVDEDGIVCIPSVRGEVPAAERLRALLAAAYGKTWSPSKQEELLSTLNPQPSTLEDWLRNGFFDQHSKLFHQRPFIWQIWDGRKDGFSALVNYHKLDHKLLEKLTYTYVGDWIKRQQEAVSNEESGADDRLLKAQQLQDKLKLILEGEAPYDIFVRWKSLEQQPIGCHPDLNDGVRLNIRPFMEADVLRKRPNIKWGTDRGKNPSGSPWGEERDNDKHLSLAEKRRARGMT